MSGMLTSQSKGENHSSLLSRLFSFVRSLCGRFVVVLIFSLLFLSRSSHPSSSFSFILILSQRSHSFSFSLLSPPLTQHIQIERDQMSFNRLSFGWLKENTTSTRSTARVGKVRNEDEKIMNEKNE
jgi:hypothetical protein